VQILVSCFFELKFARGLSGDEILVDVLCELVIKLIAFPSAEFFILSICCLKERFDALCGILELLTSNYSLSSSHILNCLVVNRVSGPHLVNVLRRCTGNFFNEALNLSNRPLTLDGLVSLNYLFQFSILECYGIICVRCLLSSFILGCWSLREERASL
jgi:hypothetical protein